MKHVVATPKSVLLVATILTLALFTSIYPISLWKPVFASPDTLTLRPNAAGTYQAWGTFGAPPSHWQGTSDQNDATGVQSPAGDTTAKETENLQDTSQTGTINSVTAYMRAKAYGPDTTRQAYYAESTAQSTTTLTTYQDKVALTFTPDDSSTYMILGTWLLQESSASYQAKAKLTRTTGTVKDFGEQIYYPKDATDYISGACLGIDTFGTSPGSQTYKIQFCSNNAFGTARIKEARITAIKLVSVDQYAQSESRSTTTLTTYQDKTTLTFTPESQGDYIIIATSILDGNSATYDFKCQLLVGATTYSITNIEPVNAANRYSWGVFVRVNLLAISQTIKVQYCSENTAATAGIANARIVVLRADQFENNYYAESNARSTTTLTSYQDKTTLTQTPQAQDHLVIGCAGADGSSESYSTYARLIEGAAVYGEMLIETKDATNRHYPYFMMYKKTLSATSTTWKMQYRTENSLNTAGIQDARIIVIQLVAGDEKATPIWKSGATEVEAGDVTISRTSFTDYSNTRTTDPDGGSWDWSDINSLEVGVRATMLGPSDYIQVSEFWIVVDYTLGFNLNLRVRDWDLTDNIQGAYVYKDSDVQISDANGWANWTLVSGTVQIKVSYYGFWVNGTFSVTMDSDKTIDVQCKLYDVTVLVQEGVQNAYLASANVTVYNSTSVQGNKITSNVTGNNGQVQLLNLPNNTLTFTQYGGASYSLVIGNTTPLVSSENQTITLTANQNNINTNNNYSIIAFAGMTIPLKGAFAKRRLKKKRNRDMEREKKRAHKTSGKSHN
jgi:hypothetical protein